MTAAEQVTEWRARAEACVAAAGRHQDAADHTAGGVMAGQHRRRAQQWLSRGEQWAALACLLELAATDDGGRALEAARRLAEGLVSP